MWYVDVSTIPDAVNMSFDASDGGVPFRGSVELFLLLYSAGEPYDWSVVEATASLVGDRVEQGVGIDIETSGDVDGNRSGDKNGSDVVEHVR